VTPLVSSGRVYRFLHKPISPPRAQLFIGAATRRYQEMRAFEPMALATVRTVRTMASQSSEVLTRCIRVLRHLPDADLEVIEDLRDRYRRLDRIATSQLDFLTGVSDFYRGRTDTRMTIAAERLAVIAAVTLPITALSGIMGMNVIVNTESDYRAIGILVLIMIVMSGVLLRWAKRQGWW